MFLSTTVLPSPLCWMVLSRAPLKPLFVIVGQSPLPSDLEPPETATLTVPSEIKRALIARLQKTEGRSVLDSVDVESLTEILTGKAAPPA